MCVKKEREREKEKERERENVGKKKPRKRHKNVGTENSRDNEMFKSLFYKSKMKVVWQCVQKFDF